MPRMPRPTVALGLLVGLGVGVWFIWQLSGRPTTSSRVGPSRAEVARGDVEHGSRPGPHRAPSRLEATPPPGDPGRAGGEAPATATPAAAIKPEIRADLPIAASATGAHPVQRMVAHYSVENLELPALLGKRLGRRPPQVVWALLDLRQAGATQAAQEAFVRDRFGPDLKLKAWTLAWLRQKDPGDAAAGGSTGDGDGKKRGFHMGALKRLEPVGR